MMAGRMRVFTTLAIAVIGASVVLSGPAAAGATDPGDPTTMAVTCSGAETQEEIRDSDGVKIGRAYRIDIWCKSHENNPDYYRGYGKIHKYYGTSLKRIYVCDAKADDHTVYLPVRDFYGRWVMDYHDKNGSKSGCSAYGDPYKVWYSINAYAGFWAGAWTPDWPLP